MQRTLPLGCAMLVVSLICFLGAYGIHIANETEQNLAGDSTAQVLYCLDSAVALPEVNESEGLWSLPDAEEYTTSAVAIDNTNYIGTLNIPALELTLPIASEWSLSQARRTPCRWTGSLNESNLILAGHNYRMHFGHLTDLESGDLVSFTDCNGEEFWYEVIETVVIAGTDIAGMLEGDDKWDLTLFTCTYGGANRVAVRCAYAEG